MSAAPAKHCFFGVSNCPVSLPIHTVGLGLVAYSAFLSYKVYQNIPTKASGGANVKMPIAIDFLGRPKAFTHPCVAAAIFPALILMQSGAECGYGMLREATAKTATKCPIGCVGRVAVQTIFGLSILTLLAQSVATRIVLDRKTPEEVEEANSKAECGKKPYALACWQLVLPFVVSFLPTISAAVCKSVHCKSKQ